MTIHERAKKILSILKKTYPDAACALHHKNPIELLVATILSAQCTDTRVNKVTPHLFKKYKKASDYAAADPHELEQEIRSTGFYRQKARMIRSAGRTMVEKFDGQVPKTMEELTTLSGVGRKTANVILGNIFGIPGVVVDTHVRRLSYHMGFTTKEDPNKIEQELMKLYPRKDWVQLSHCLIFHGRRICTALRPDCPNCPVNSLCPKLGVTTVRKAA